MLPLRPRLIGLALGIWLAGAAVLVLAVIAWISDYERQPGFILPLLPLALGLNGLALKVHRRSTK